MILILMLEKIGNHAGCGFVLISGALVANIRYS